MKRDPPTSSKILKVVRKISASITASFIDLNLPFFQKGITIEK